MRVSMENVRRRVLSNVNSYIDLITEKIARHERTQHAWANGFQQAWTSLMLSRLRPKLLWWNEIKMAIESDDPLRVLPALDRLIARYLPDAFYLTWIAPISRNYWEYGLGPIAKHIANTRLRVATILRLHYRRQLA